jgi:cytochrome c556
VGRIAGVLACCLAGIGITWAAAPVVGQGAGWTGATNSKDVIKARQELMEHIELLMEPIDTITVRPVGDIARLHQNAEVIAAMLGAVPHLFPPTTNRYDPKAALPETLALAPIWSDFPTFYRLAGAAVEAAEGMAAAQGTTALRAASLKLRGSCDTCHALFLRKYVPPRVQESDRQFDFDAALKRN